MHRFMRWVLSIRDRLLAIMVPAEGEEWLVLLVVGLMLLGGARHHLEPWLEGIAAGPPPEVERAISEVDIASFGRVDLNRAGVAELETLPRIGPALAARIVADRSTRGRFRSVDELDRVKGIGPATIAAIRDEAMVGEEPDSLTAIRDRPPRATIQDAPPAGP